MKSKLFISSLVLSALFAQSQVFAAVLPGGVLLEPQKFMSCKLTKTIYDGEVSVTLLKERVGPAETAVVSRMTIAGTTDTVYANLTSRPKIIEGDEAVGTIYSAHTDTSSLELTVDYYRSGDDGVSPSTLKLDNETYDMLCTPYMTVN